MRFNFRNDYSAVAHKRVLDALVKAYGEKNTGYGLDIHTLNAKNIILSKIGKPNADVHFLVGGTQTNMVTISTILKPYEAVIACKSGHIAVHETGAIEGQGHKVITVDGKDGKVLKEEIENMVLYHCDKHMVLPRMVYISNTTEVGTAYSKEELYSIREVCDKHGLYLFIDGARLASYLALDNGVDLKVIAEVADVFYIGGTKNGGLFGEALVIVNENLQPGFDYAVKHYGALLAKGFVTGIIFEELMKDDLYLEIGKHINLMANRLSTGLKELGVKFLNESSTNQIFPIFNNLQLEKLSKICDYEVILVLDSENTCIRFVTSFETTADEIDEFIEEIKSKIL